MPTGGPQRAMEGSDSEYEEEEIVVLAELNGLVDDELLRKGCTYQFVGIDTDKPVLQLGKYNFLGSYEDQIGSALFLQETTDEEGRKAWSKLCFSDKKLSMQRVFLRKKGEEMLPPLPDGAEQTAAMEEEAAAVSEPALGREPGQDQEPESEPKPGPSAAADEKRPEQRGDEESPTAALSVAAAVAGDEVSSDVDMPPVEGTETAPVEAQSFADKPSSGSDH